MDDVERHPSSTLSEKDRTKMSKIMKEMDSVYSVVDVDFRELAESYELSAAEDL